MRTRATASLRLVALCVFSAGCGTGLAPTALHSNAHLARAGSGATRAGFAVGAAATASGASLPLAQGAAGVDLGRHYTLYGRASRVGLGAEGAVFALNGPRASVGLVHGLFGRVQSLGDIRTLEGVASVGPVIAIGTDARFFAAARADFSGSKFSSSLAPVNGTSALGKTLSASAGWWFPGELGAAAEIGVARPLGTAGELVLLVGVGLFAEVPR